jgi:glucose/arabinose dehydrogenase
VRTTRAGVWSRFVALLVIGLLATFTTLAVTLPAGFQETVVFSGLTNPTAVRFASDGRVFVAEKSGIIKVFDSLTDTTPTVFADLRTEVHNFWDRGLLGLALDPNFPKSPYVYVLYTYDAPIGGTAPTWGVAGATSDGCPNPPGATQDGCVVSGRLSRLQAAGNVMTGTEQVLIEDWCQQFPSHSIGNLAFGADGKLYVSGGEGANFLSADYGQFGSFIGPTPRNPCGDPPTFVGGFQIPPTAEGGALRSQDLRTLADPVGLNGAVLRVDPATGAGLPDNPLGSSADANARRIVGYGFRNPFRFAIKPGTNDLWVGDVGWNDWEEIDRIPSPTSATVGDFGWPCYEGVGRQPSYDATNLDICENLYSQPGAVTAPLFTYAHSQSVVAGDGCSTGGSSISGLAFYGNGNYPSAYHGALFFADYTRRCMWVMFPGAGGDPDPANRAAFASSAAFPVDLQIGPGGDLFYVDLDGGTVRRIQYHAVTAIATGAPLTGPVPLTVNFDGSSSHGASLGDVLTYSWDLDGDGLFGDSSAVSPSHEYDTAGVYDVRLRVSDAFGGSDVSAPVHVFAGNTPPAATIATPLPGTTWTVGTPIGFSGSATDPQDGPLPASALTWTWILHHCPSDCHSHPLQAFSGVSSGSFPAPDHDYPSYLELQLTATDSGSLTDTKSILLYPETVSLTFDSNPSSLQLAFGSEAPSTPFARTVIVGSSNSVNATSPQTLGGVSYGFSSWSDGGAQAHSIVAGASPATYVATYAPSSASFYTLSPCRLADTRDPDGPLGGPPIAAGTVRTFSLSGACGLPSTATSVSLNVTATGSPDDGFLSIYPGGQPTPPTSTMNYRAGQTRANNAIVPLGAGGLLSVFCSQASGGINVILDVNGYFQ